MAADVGDKRGSSLVVGMISVPMFRQWPTRGGIRNK